ncbi:MAG: DUF3662 domain-containing protein [Dehalococcoidia bacterium]|nr:FHA domain-containing protein [Dehalococcoidia bacterium]NUQ54618.1 DUF3662 domain-containing protein [Dehalococcoidia bacterium]
MSGARGNPLERLLEQAARGLSGALHPLEVLEQVRTAFDDAVAGETAPNAIVVAFNRADFAAYVPAFEVLRERIHSLLAAAEEERGLRRIGDRLVTFEESAAVPAASVAVSARFVDTASRSSVPAPAGATSRFVPERGLWLVLGDGSRIAVTHTPFNIGRGAGNDLLLPGLSVSRRHAELVRTARGYLLRDLGSRNGLVTGGVRQDEVIMQPGVVVAVGEFELSLEQLA